MSNDTSRYISDIIDLISFKYGKMAFVSGPRQVGKTTLAKGFLTHRGEGKYYTWDDREFRKLWGSGAHEVVKAFHESNLHDLPNEQFTRPLIILDELHKDSRWKTLLKGLFDLYQAELDILVTGSARLNIFKRGGDSLLGRYFNFRLHPFSVAELLEKRCDSPLEVMNKLFGKKTVNSSKELEIMLGRLEEFGGFPDPYFNHDKRFANLWRAGRLEKLIREDLRDLSRLPELSQVELLAQLLPDRVGSPISTESLRQDVEVTHDTVKRWLNYLESLYYHFTIRPYSKRIPRALKKEPKIFLYDWSEVANPGARFENLVASHLLKACDYWTDSGQGAWNLTYLRNKEKQEVDFLVTLKDKPMFSVECKYADSAFDPSILSFSKHTRISHHIQIVREPGIWKISHVNDMNVLIASAEFVLPEFV